MSGSSVTITSDKLFFFSHFIIDKILINVFVYNLYDLFSLLYIVSTRNLKAKAECGCPFRLQYGNVHR